MRNEPINYIFKRLMIITQYTGGPMYPRFQLSTVGRGPKKNWKIKEINSS
jgi:hypothetical protein